MSTNIEVEKPATNPTTINHQVTTPPEVNLVLSLLPPGEYVKPITATFDLRSQKGQFGWDTLGTIHVPSIFRVHVVPTVSTNNVLAINNSIKYTALRIVNQQVLRPFFNVFKQQLFDILEVSSYQMTEAERKTYNEINFNHCDSVYGLNSFQKDEQLLRLDELITIYDFLSFLKRRLALNEPVLHPRYGYISVNGSSNLVPFCKVGPSVLLPIFYFEGDEINLKKKLITIHPTAENIVRVLMELQSVKIDPQPNRINFINFEEIKKYFESSAKHVDKWIEGPCDRFLIKSKTNEMSILKIRRVDDEPTLLSNSNFNNSKKTIELNGLKTVHSTNSSG